MSRIMRTTRKNKACGLIWACAITLILGGCFFEDSPAKLNRKIEEGSPAKALEEINKQLLKTPSSQVYNLLAAKAQLAQCARENCPTTNPDKLTLVAGLLEAAGNTPVSLGKKEPQLSTSSVVSFSIPLFAKLTPQPDTLLVLYKNLPAPYNMDVLSAMFSPALNHARQGETTAAAENLKILGHTENLPPPARAFALALAGMFENSPTDTESQIISLRSLNGEIPPGAAALVPWALLAQSSVSGTTAAKTTLQALPSTLESWKLSNVLTDRSKSGLTQELNTIRSTNSLSESWSKTFGGNNNLLSLTLQRLSLSINPNQPDIWNIYLPTLISSAASGTVPDLAGGLTFSSLGEVRLTSDTQQRLAGQLLQAATTLQQQPSMAAPLVVMAGSLDLTRQQQIDLDKLTQQLMIKAAAGSDVTATAILAKFRPEVALNNRQTVVPLLVANIRQSLRTQNFQHAIETAKLLHNTLQLDVQLDPIIIEEFTDEMKRINIAAQLDTESPDLLLQEPDTIQLDLGPLFTFMQQYFAEEPQIITAQLTTLIANARGTYGPSTAMYRLNSLFPEEGMPSAKREEWLNQAITEAVSNDRKLSGPEIITLTIRLAKAHPGLSPAPLLESALARTSSLDEYRAIWKSSPDNLRGILSSIRPQFTSFMRGVDAYEAGKLNAAATSFSEITEPKWYAEAKSYFGKMQEILAQISGVYVPVTSLSSTKTGAIIISPAGLGSGALQSVSVTFVNRLGTLTESNPGTYNTTPAAIHRVTLSAPLDLDARRITLTEDVLDQLTESGSFSKLFGNINTLSIRPGAGKHNGILQASQDGSAGPRTTLTLTRTLVSPQTALRPDGTYAIQSGLNKPQPGTETILPTGTLITFKTAAEPSSPPENFGLPARYVYAVSGTLNHPSTPTPIAFEGAYDPSTFALEFTFSYPLPSSKLPVKAQVRCQALAGPLMCGAHHLHSPRLQFATLVAGMQTQESLARSARQREELNTTDYNEMLSIAAEYQPPQPPAPEQPSSTITLSPTLPVEVSATQTDSPTISPTNLISPSLTAAPSQQPSASTPDQHAATPEEEEEETSPAPTTTPAPTSTTHKSVTTVTLSPGEKVSESIPAGVFIHKTNAKPASN